MKELIKKLKDKSYVKAFGLMSDEERQCLRNVGWKNRIYYADKGWVTDCDVIGLSSYRWPLTFAIKPDYQQELKFVDLEIEEEGGFLGVYIKNKWYAELPYAFTHLFCLPSLPNFEEFRYESSPGMTICNSSLTGVAKRISEGRKVYARFRS